MSKRLKITFYILLGLYIILILSSWDAIYSFSKMLGAVEAIKKSSIFYQIIIVILAFLMFKKKKIALPISFVLMFYWLVTMPGIGVNREGLGAIIYIYNSFINGFWQTFFLLLSSWLIPIVSLVGCIYWYLDVKKSKSLDKHWSE
ncbi:hypothetical protein [Francisella marina]|uniref:Uncharacterized protein n=1 Tax=Francisella marina TaxID=2249302 RepID=A0ABX5ZFI2_9GAMM|nr:hypothetical protein [Francisella marina]QEO57028.1 hypothetical protein F0R74_03855 [Francisella marina]QEO58856.1 hypothetical protein F0R75_03375 [Francisella marina]